MSFKKRENHNYYLRNVIWKWRGVPLEWGKTDCGLFAIQCFEAITGELPPIELPQHDSVETALEYQKQHDSVESFFERYVGDCVEKVQGRYWQDGDFAVFDTDELWISTGVFFSGMVAGFDDDGLQLRLVELCQPIKAVYRIDK